MNDLRKLIDRARLSGELWLHRHGPWWLLLGVLSVLLLGGALLALPRLHAELAGQQALLAEWQARATQPLAEAPSQSVSEINYQLFRDTLAEENQVLPTIQAILDAAASHRLIATRAEYQRTHDVNAQADTLQMTIPVSGQYRDVRRWIEEILATQAFVAVTELGAKREDIALNQIEARVRLNLWYRPETGGRDAGRVDP